MREEEISWHNREEKDKRPDPIRFMPARIPGPTFDTKASWSPLSLFQLFFSTTVVRTIIDKSMPMLSRDYRLERSFFGEP